MRTDSLDRPDSSRKRFTKLEIASIMQEAGLHKITFSENFPFGAVGRKI